MELPFFLHEIKQAQSMKKKKIFFIWNVLITTYNDGKT
jgi:hypothetical protein